MQGGQRRGGGRYRRRGSVTKYSMNTADTVKQEYNEHEDMINKFRNQSLSAASTPNLSTTGALSRSASGDSGDMSDPNDPDAGKKKKKKKGFMKAF